MTRPALLLKSGSLIEIQLRYDQGLMASALSHRQTVIPLMEPTIRCLMTSRAMSRSLKRDNGMPLSLGSSQARAFTSITTSGGKYAGTTASCLIPKTGQALFKETLPPFRDDLTGQLKPPTDLLILKPFGSKEDDLGPHDFIVR